MTGRGPDFGAAWLRPGDRDEDPGDEDLHAKIEALVAEEHELRQRHTSSAEANAALDDDERARMSSVEVQLDRTWDLPRQRGARRRAGQDPEATHERPAGEVEGYTG